MGDACLGVYELSYGVGHDCVHAQWLNSKTD